MRLVCYDDLFWVARPVQILLAFLQRVSDRVEAFDKRATVVLDGVQNVCPDPGHDQVWSLTQFYSVDFSQSRIGVKKCVFNKRTIKVCVSCCGRCPGTSAPSAAHLTVSLYLCSSGSNALGESRAQEGRRVSSKTPSWVRDGDEGVAGRNGREKCFPDEGH